MRKPPEKSTDPCFGIPRPKENRFSIPPDTYCGYLYHPPYYADLKKRQYLPAGEYGVTNEVVTGKRGTELDHTVKLVLIQRLSYGQWSRAGGRLQTKYGVVFTDT